MGNNNNYQRLGRKTFWVFLLNHIAPSAILLIIAIGLLAAGGSGVLAKTPVGDLSNYGSLGATIASAAFILVFLATLLVS